MLLIRISISETIVIKEASYGDNQNELSKAIPPFARLEGTREEGVVIADKLRVKPMFDSGVLKGRIKSVRSPKILHIATQGYFLPDKSYDMRNDKTGFKSVSDIRAHSMTNTLSEEWENPLLRSGLALTGANTWLAGGPLPEEAGNGILTAEDVSGMDLLNTELVVLSASETGLGAIRTGEGVFGLRRAFELAGAHTLIVSLWKVSDEQTRELMVDLYNRMASGQSISNALRQAKLMMKQKYLDPFYWGAFICQGNPNSSPLRSLNLQA